jgi:hypothetical protein
LKHAPGLALQCLACSSSSAAAARHLFEISCCDLGGDGG